MSPNPYLLSRFTSNIPMPTLYVGDSVRKPKLSVIEVLLYNMAALLAGVAAGYDVRMSNVSPVHPTLLSDVPALKAPLEMEYPKVVDERRFTSNTYHGPGRHNRMAISAVTYAPEAEESPILRRTEEIASQLTTAPATTQYYQQLPAPTPHQQQQPSTISTTSGLGSNFTTNTSGMLSSSLGSSNTQPPTPSPRRKISTSSFTENLEYSEQDDSSPPMRPFEGFRIGGGPPPLYAPADYLRNGPSFSNDGGAYGAGAHRTGYFGSNYFPYRPELSLAFERDCKSYPDYSYDYNHHLPNYYDYNYDQQPAVTRTPPPRVPHMGITAAGHRRTPSNISNNSNMNQGFTHEHEDLLPEFYDYNNLNLNIVGATDFSQQQHQLFQTAGSGEVPPPPKHELYKSSPKLSNLAAVARNADIISLNRMRDYENLPQTSSPAHKPSLYQHQRHNYVTVTAPATATSTPTHTTPKNAANNHAQPSMLMPQERPASLPFEPPHLGLGIKAGTKLRSSLKKYNFKTPNGSITASSQQGTPTNPTPPDSLTSDDSSYLSAKEGSISSQHSRVRFSPEFFLDASCIGERNGGNGGGGGGGSVLSGSATSHSSGGEYGSASRGASISVINRRISRRTSDMTASSSPSS